MTVQAVAVIPDEPPAKKHKTIRCELEACIKKVEVIWRDYPCKFCKADFCAAHRLPEAHLCTSNYQGIEKEALAARLRDEATPETHNFTRIDEDTP
jgi:predicted nucleic acid binding AN1-type Zn finger protein